MTLRRGDVWVADFGEALPGEPGDRRPVVVVSNDGFNDSRAWSVTVVPGTSTDRKRLDHLTVEPSETGLRRPTVFQPELVTSLSRQRLIARVGRLNPGRMAMLDELLLSFLALA